MRVTSSNNQTQKWLEYWLKDSRDTPPYNEEVGYVCCIIALVTKYAKYGAGVKAEKHMMNDEIDDVS